MTRLARSRGEGLRNDEDARRLALGCKLQVLVSLGVFGMKIYNFAHSGIASSTVHKEIYKKMPRTLITQKSPVGVSLSLSHT